MPLYILLGVALSLATTVPLAWKWILGVRRTVVTVVALSLMTGALMEATAPPFADTGGTLLRAAAHWLLTLVVLFALTAYRFYRDPERKVPDRANGIVSPADGKVVYVRESQRGTLPVSTKKGHSYTLTELTRTPLAMNDAVVIGITMNLLDVHVNRAPIAGLIATRRHFPGLFGSLRRTEMVFLNERMTTVVENNDLQVAVVQIASRLVRQIRSFVHERDHVQLGQRIGAIRFGSQVDLVLPLRPDVEVTVKPGDRVTAGQSIVAVVRP